MSYVQYSPWQDAAQVGKGIGDALGAILFKLPQMRAEERRANRELDIKERHYAAMEETYGPRARQIEMQTSLLPLNMAMKQATLELQQQRQEVNELVAQARVKEMESRVRLNDTKNEMIPQKFLADENYRLSLGEDRDFANQTGRMNAEANQGFLGIAKDAIARKQGAEPMPEVNDLQPTKPGMIDRIKGAFQKTYDPQEIESAMYGTQPTNNLIPAQVPEELVNKAREVKALTSPSRRSLMLQPQQSPLSPEHMIAPEIMGQISEQEGQTDYISTDAPPAPGKPLFRAFEYPGHRIMNSKDAPPSPTKRIQIQDPDTGAYYWTDEVGVRMRPDWKVIQRY